MIKCKSPEFIMFRQAGRQANNSYYKQFDYSVATIRYIKYSGTPFLEGHNICLDSSNHWNIYLQKGTINIHYPDEGSMDLD